MDQATKKRLVAQMQRDLTASDDGWSDSVILQANGRDWTPNQLMEEVKNGTDFGNQYLEIFNQNNEYLKGILGDAYDTIFEPTINEQSN